MRKSLQKKMTGSMLVAVVAALAIVSVCLLFGMARYAGTQFENDVSQVLTTDLLSEMNENATGTADSAAAEIETMLDAYAGQLRIGSGRSYSIWDAATGDRLAGDENAVMTDNMVTAMSGTVGDAMPLLPTKMDIAVPVTGESALIVDIQDDGSRAQALMARLAVLLLAGLVLSLLAAVGISWILAKAFSESAAQTAQELRDNNAQALAPRGDWEAMAAALYAPEKKRKKGRDRTALDVLLPFLQEGYVLFQADGKVLEINMMAERLLGATMEAGKTLRFADVFHDVPMPTAEQSLVRGKLRQNDFMLDVTFAALEPGLFAAVVLPSDRRAQ